MSEEIKTVAVWGYSKDGPKLFQIKAGKKLPAGFYDSPAKVPSAKAKKSK